MSKKKLNGMKHNSIFLHHIIDEINFLISQTTDLNYNKFMESEVLKKASARSLEIIGEAVKNLSLDFRKKHKDIEWRKLAGLRDKIIHYYFGVNWDILWDVIEDKLPEIKIRIEAILEEIDDVKK